MRTRITVELLHTLDEEGRKLDPGSLFGRRAMHETQLSDALQQMSKAVDDLRRLGWSTASMNQSLAVLIAVRKFAQALCGVHDLLVSIDDDATSIVESRSHERLS